MFFRCLPFQKVFTDITLFVLILCIYIVFLKYTIKRWSHGSHKISKIWSIYKKPFWVLFLFFSQSSDTVYFSIYITVSSNSSLCGFNELLRITSFLFPSISDSTATCSSLCLSLYFLLHLLSICLTLILWDSWVERLCVLPLMLIVQGTILFLPFLF